MVRITRNSSAAPSREETVIESEDEFETIENSELNSPRSDINEKAQQEAVEINSPQSDTNERAQQENVEINSPQSDTNERAQQRQKIVYEPYDISLSNNVLFTNARFTAISLAILESTEAIKHKLNFKYIDLQIIRVITSNQSVVNVYRKKKSNEVSGQIKFSRLFLARVCSDKDDNARLVYIMEARNQNNNIWKKNINLRDNGAITIGCLIQFPSPMPITQYMRCDIPMLVSQNPSILLKSPSKLPSIQITEDIGSNTSLGFIYNGTHLSVDYTSVVETTCSGNFCDRQRINDWLGNKGCGCYGMSINSTNLSIQHSICMTSAMKELRMNEFSSLKFSQLYLSGDFAGSCKLYMLQLNDRAVKLYEAVDECIDFINDNGGFTVIGWYKRGQITDKSLTSAKPSNNTLNHNSNDEEIHVDAGDISYHIVSVYPTNRDFLDPSKSLFDRLKRKKFDVMAIESC